MKKLESRCFTNEKTVKKAQKNKLGKYKKSGSKFLILFYLLKCK